MWINLIVLKLPKSSFSRVEIHEKSLNPRAKIWK